MKKSPFPFHLTPGGPRLTRTLIAQLPDALRLDPDASLLLIGCRQGENALGLAEHFSGRIVGIEEDSESIFFGKMAATEMALASRVSLQYMAPTATNFRNGQFNVILIEGVMSSYLPTRVLKEALRLLADDGWLLMSDSCWLESEVPPYVRNVWESPERKILTPPLIQSMLEERDFEVLQLDDRSDVLGPFYRQFQETVRGIAKSGFEGMKHQKTLVKHYKHEIDVYHKNGGDRYMGYFSAVARRAAAVQNEEEQKMRDPGSAPK
ncbi:MAG: methyltransferase domain-containing protein [Bacteroidota bacterium]